MSKLWKSTMTLVFASVAAGVLISSPVRADGGGGSGGGWSGGSWSGGTWSGGNGWTWDGNNWSGGGSGSCDPSLPWSWCCDPNQVTCCDPTDPDCQALALINPDKQ